MHKRISIIFLACALGLLGCGKKAPPVAPQEKPLPAVNDLQGHRDGDRILLSWRLPVGDVRSTTQWRGFRVYRTKQALNEEACDGCPQRFEVIADIPLNGANPHGSDSVLLQYTDKIEKGFRYVYKVVGLGPAARESGASNPVAFVY